MIGIRDSLDQSGTIVKNTFSPRLSSPNTEVLPAAPRNVGINAACGRYVAFLDCDDLWLPTKLERQFPLFEIKNIAVVFSYYAKNNYQLKDFITFFRCSCF
ncbi:MAG: glycosyltransferase family 2 protein [Treponema sp.]|nr:glycosyltransferase family 2 protein [Treponema sp.]MBD5440128.1 glycosyltransferase family 2 protein [Treponema sp.]